ncbi:MAG: hypothetical protein QM820_04530 [Minicystis sp.]
MLLENERRRRGLRRDVHIRITFAGKEPGPILLGKRDALEKRLSADKAGTALRRTVGAGCLDIYVVTVDPARTTEIAWKHVNELGLASRTTVRDEGVEPRRGAGASR